MRYFRLMFIVLTLWPEYQQLRNISGEYIYYCIIGSVMKPLLSRWLCIISCLFTEYGITTPQTKRHFSNRTDYNCLCRWLTSHCILYLLYICAPIISISPQLRLPVAGCYATIPSSLIYKPSPQKSIQN